MYLWKVYKYSFTYMKMINFKNDTISKFIKIFKITNELLQHNEISNLFNYLELSQELMNKYI